MRLIISRECFTEPAKLITQYLQKGKGYSKSKKGLLDKYSLLCRLGQGGDLCYQGKIEFKGLP